MGGGGGGLSRIARDIGGAALAIPTGGASLNWGPDTKRVGGYTPGGWLANGAQTIYDNVSGKNARNLAKQEADQLNQSIANQNALNQQLLQAPKAIQSDNFLATKAGQLANLRLGLASTITGTGGAPSPLLSWNSLTAGGGKSKLGQ